MMFKLKTGILGAGISGLASLKHAIENGHKAICFERYPHLGGIWNGRNTMGGIYKGLKTTIPKEIMVLQGVEHEENPNSFVGQPEIFKYIQTYAKTFNLDQYISFNHEVISIEPMSNDPMTKWHVAVKNLKTNEDVGYEFDALMIAPGRCTDKYVAEIKNAELFEGKMLHSREFYDPEDFTDQRVLVIGSGPPGIDIANRVAKYSRVSYISRKATSYKYLILQNTILSKTEVDHFDANGAYFKDGSYELLDVIIYCTGYQYKLPFIKPECGVKIEDNSIKYLYQHCINIERPSMAFIGLPYRTTLFPIVDFQARYFVAYLSKKFFLPAQKDMLTQVSKEFEEYKIRGLESCGFHAFNDSCRYLINSMAKESGIAPIDKVMFDIMDLLQKNWSNRHSYKIIDSETYIRTKLC